MIRHIVFFKLKSVANQQQSEDLLNQVRLKLEELPARIPQILSFETGINAIPGKDAADLSLTAVFADAEDLRTYQEHPEHKAFVEWNREICPKFSVIDYHI